MESRKGGGPGHQREGVCCLSEEVRAWEVVGGRRRDRKRKE